MKRFSLLSALFFLLISFSPIQSQTRPQFIQKCIKEYGGGFAWGTGLDKDMKGFYWFSVFNIHEDVGSYQLKLSRNLKPDEIEKIFELIDKYRNPWACNGDLIAVGKIIDWHMDGMIKIAKKYRKILSEEVFKKMRVIEYF